MSNSPNFQPSPYLFVNQVLLQDQYLLSANGVFSAWMQDDGNFVVYRGTVPQNNYGALWYTNSYGPGQCYAAFLEGGLLAIQIGTPENFQGTRWTSLQNSTPGNFYMVLQDDGNLVINRGTGPDDNHGLYWCSGVTDPVESYSANSLEYHLDQAKIEDTNIADIYSIQLENNTGQPQISTVSGTESTTETSGWSDTLGVSVSVSTSFKCGVPIVADGKVSLSVTVSNSYTWSGSESTSRQWSFNMPVSVPANTTYQAVMAVKVSKIAVPFTMSGGFTLKSGTYVPGASPGLYTGSNSHSLQITLNPINPGSSTATPITQSVEALDPSPATA
ncbi:MAG TPA: ETX/MTX2 family pore-forming toxin [Bacteroidia bacterium]|nr:ETX/MTX2 family pore-forming toxin [Bacteroidia bacterium]